MDHFWTVFTIYSKFGGISEIRRPFPPLALTFSDLFVKEKVGSLLVGGAPELIAASSVLWRASPQMQGAQYQTKMITTPKYGLFHPSMSAFELI